MRTRAEEWFLERYRELEGALANPTGPNLIRATLALRMLLFDNPNLADRVNKKRLTLTFEVSKWRECPIPADFYWQEPAPRADKKHSMVVRKDGFYKLPCMTYKGRTFTVKQVIDMCAYVRGGIHFGEPRNPEEELMDEADGMMNFTDLGYPSTTLTLTLKRAIQVVVDGLKPLVELVTK